MKLSMPEYGCLAMLRNSMSIGGKVHGATINSLRRKGLIGKYDAEITDKGNAVMDAYSAKGKSPDQGSGKP